MKRISVTLLFFFLVVKVEAQQLITVYDSTNTPLVVNKVNCLAWEGNTLWAGSEYGFTSFDGSNWNFYLFDNQSASYLNNIFAINVDASGNKWIGTAGGGMGKFDGTNWTIYKTSNCPIPSNIVKAITIDNQNRMWIGTTAGVAVWDMDTTWIIYQQFSSALMSDNIECIVPSSNDTMWVGTVNGGLTRFVDTSLLTYTIQNNGVPDNTIQDVAIGANGYRWLGCAAHGLSTFIYNSPPFVQFNPANSDMPSYTVNSLAIDNSGKVLCGTFDGGLVRYLGSIYWEVFNDSSFALPDSSINDILLDSSGVIWLATTNKGVIRFDEPQLYASTQNLNSTFNSSLKIFPNPSADFIEMNISSNGNENKFRIEIFDEAGNKLREDFIQPTNSFSKIRMDISGFSSGIYFLRISSDSNIQSGVFVKL